MKPFFYMILAALAMLTVPAVATWNGLRCERCGCDSSCQKVCRLVCEMKETTKVTYCCKCEDFCVPGPSVRCKPDCNCGQCESCQKYNWQPTCADVRTKKVLDKKVEKVVKPTYRWVVEYLCPTCCKCAPQQ